MKKLLLLILPLLLGQASAQSQLPVVFSKYFDFEPNIAEGAFRVINLPNGYAFTGIRYCPDGSVCVDLAQVDFDGNLIFHDTILGTSFINGAIYDPMDNTIMLCGEIETANGFYEVVLIKRALDGKTIWKKKYENASFSFNVERDIVKLPDGGFMILGNRGILGSHSTVFLMRTDTEGNVLWIKDYEQDYKHNWARSLILVSDTTVAFVVHNRHTNSSLYNTSGLVKTNLDGNVIWASHIYNEDYSDVVVGDMLKNGDFVLNTSIDTLCDGCIGNGPLVVCLSPEGEVKWQRFFLYRILEFVSIKGTSDGGVLLCGYGVAQDIGQGTAASFLIKLSADGEVLWERVINIEDQIITPQANIAIEASDSGIVVGATHFRYHNNGATIEQDAWLLKLGEDGCFVPDCDDTLMIITPVWEPPGNAEDEKKWQQVKVYPNPAQDFFDVTMNDNSLPLGGQIIISDFLGRRKQESFITERRMRFSTVGLPNGGYFLQIISPEGRLLGASNVLVFR